ncbi:MAG: ABC transporter permease subunit, partial [Proteobacteria bacterium]|nr:ABC transporter permease subunit [Pseudomonadota bacterium]
MSLIFYLPICLIFSMGFLFPVVSLFVSGFKGFNLAFFSDPFFEHVVTFTYGQALVSSLLSVFLGLVVAFLIQEWKVVGGRFLWRFCLLCSSLPSIIVALGILGAWGPGSILGRIVFDQRTVFGWPGLLLGHVFLNFSIPMRLIGNALRERNRTSELTALSIGMNRWSVFWKITLPEVRTSVLSSWILTFLFCSTSLFIVLFLGGGPRFTTLEVSLYEAVKLNFDNGKAVQIASLQALVGIGLYVVYLKAQRPPRIKS